MSLYRFMASDKEMPEYGTNNTNTMVIVDGLDISKEEDMDYVSQYTDKEFVNYVEFNYNLENAQKVIDYIKDLLKDRFAVLLYNTWDTDKSPLTFKSININDLTVETIKELWGQESFKNNECLKIYKEY